jgi:hypothetical protein
MSYIVLRGCWCSIIVLNAADVNILGRIVHTIEKNTEALVVASKETRLQVMLIKLSTVPITSC